MGLSASVARMSSSQVVACIITKPRAELDSPQFVQEGKLLGDGQEREVVPSSTSPSKCSFFAG